MRKLFFPVLTLGLTLSALSAAAQKTAYGYTMMPSSSPAMVSFTIEDPTSTTRLGSYDRAEPRSGAAVKGVLYMMGIDDDFYTWFYRMDMATGESETIKKLGDITIPTDMAYDYSTETMYSIANSEEVDGVSALSTVNLENGTITCVDNDLGCFCKAIAIDARGQMYVMGNNGILYKVNKGNGDTEEIGQTGIRFAGWWNFQSMEFDRETGTLYLAAWTADEKSVLYTIDTATAAATLVGTIGDGTHTIALSIPYEPADGSAPERVTDFTVTPDANGELKATLSWTNPSKDYNGNDLDAPISIEYTNSGNGVTTIINDCVPGEAMTVEYEAPSTGMYSFTIIACNAAGASLEQTAEVWIGHDLPAAVTGAKATLNRTSLMMNDLTWEAPVTGAHGGYFDTKTLKYDIIRVNDNKTIAQDLSGTSFTDVDLLHDLTRYTYRIVAKNDDGVGEAAATNDLVNGPAVKCPYDAEFNTWEESGQYWTVLDGNDDGYPFVWYNDFMNMFGQGEGKGYYIYQPSEVFYAHDFIISPPIEFTEGHEYKITATVSNDDIAGYREESFRFYTFAGYDLNGAMPLGDEAFTVKHPGEFRDYSFTFKVEDDGLGTAGEIFASFIALCCTSHYDMGMLLVSRLTVEDLTSDAIQEISMDGMNDADAPCYNVAGQRVNSDASGIIIKNGHKMLKH